MDQARKERPHNEGAYGLHVNTRERGKAVNSVIVWCWAETTPNYYTFACTIGNIRGFDTTTHY